MTRFITDPGTRDAIAKIEGSNWLRDNASGQYSFDGARDAWDRFQADLDRPEFDSDGWVRRVEENGPTGAIIYGDCGLNRYFVLTDGEVVFSWFHARRFRIKAEAASYRAEIERLGFTIVGAARSALKETP